MIGSMVASDSPETLTCLTSDVVESRTSENREELQGCIETVLHDANGRFATDIVVPFSVTLGDEWQGLVSGPHVAFEVDFWIRRRLHPFPVCSGIGVGSVSTDIRQRTAAMDGPCFHRSRAALNKAKSRKGPATVLDSGEPLLDQLVNAICLLLHAIASRWTEKQCRSVMAYLDHGTEAAAAESRGVTQPTLHQSLAGAQGKDFLEGYQGLIRFLREYPPGQIPPVTR